MTDDLKRDVADAARQLSDILRDARDSAPRDGHLPNAHDEILETMEEAVWINTHWDIAWPTWPAGLRAKVVAVAQKVIRALISWYVERMMQDQNRYNLAGYRAVQILSEQMRDLQMERVRDRALIEALNVEVAELQRCLEDGKGEG